MNGQILKGVREHGSYTAMNYMNYMKEEVRTRN